jgi:hypothetical protein
MGAVSMYGNLLLNALDQWGDGLDGTALLEHARSCRGAVEHRSTYGKRNLDLLAAELAYDRALVRLCEYQGITVDASWFNHPALARLRLERQLAASGLDLAAYGTPGLSP